MQVLDHWSSELNISHQPTTDAKPLASTLLNAFQDAISHFKANAVVTRNVGPRFVSPKLSLRAQSLR